MVQRQEVGHDLAAQPPRMQRHSPLVGFTIATLGIALSLVAKPALAGSYYPLRLEDARAIYLTRNNFAVKGDGVGDDTGVLQAAINKVHQTRNQGILFIPSGRYRIAKTVYICTNKGR